ncbi:ankyrin repeat and KH domain-containing protein mask-like [Haliotis cracherodii]|uniref:ankyrin repeat and KH domain-containing protein mask-like n=1 Tax=Haliotis cracherodii TaxID=6455 RepID=UPI0039E7C619
MAESSTHEEMLSSDESSGEVRVHIPVHNLILYVTEARVLRVEFTSCQSWPHETSWSCSPTRNLSLNTPKLRAQLGELKERWESRGEHLTSIRSGSLIFVFGHDTEDDAIQMAARHSEIKEAILLFLHEIGSQVKNIRMEAVVQEAKRTAKRTPKRTAKRTPKRTAKRQKQQKESGQSITGMDGDSTAIHSNVSGTQNVQEMHQVEIKGDVILNVNCETSWRSTPAPNKHISQVPMNSFHRLGKRISEFCLATLRRVTRGSLIFSFAHTTSEDAIDMIVKHRKVKEVFLDFVQELDPSVEDIRIEVVLRELSVSEDQTTQITETRPRGMADPEHKDEEGASCSHPQQKDDDETSHPHIQESGDNSSSPSHSPQTKDEDTCLPHLQKTEEDKTSIQQTEEDTSHLHPQQTEGDKMPLQQTDEYTSHLHPQKTEGDKTSLQQTDEDTSHLHPQKTEEDETPQQTDEYTSHLQPQQVYVKVKFKYQTTGIEKGSGSHSSGYISSDPSLNPLVKGQDSDRHASSDPSRRRRYPWFSTASHATPSRADYYLFYASGDGDLEEVKRLLTTPGVDINSRGEWSRTPVIEAAYWGHREVVELLVSEGADVSLVDVDGDNILHYACRGGDVETVKYVLSLHVVDINSRGDGSRTPVMEAAEWGHREVVELLVSEGADVSMVDKVGHNILHLACIRGDVETVKYVLSLHVVDINSRGDGSRTPVMEAAEWGRREVVELLVSEGADVSMVDKVGHNILHLACMGGYVEMVEFVLSLHVVDIDARNNRGQTAADVARRRRHQPVVDLLVSRGAQ